MNFNEIYKESTNQELLEESSRWKAAVLAGLLAISGSTGAFAKSNSKATKPEVKIEQITKDLPKQLSEDEFVDFYKSFTDIMYGAKTNMDRLSLGSKQQEALNTLNDLGISVEGWSYDKLRDKWVQCEGGCKVNDLGDIVIKK